MSTRSGKPHAKYKKKEKVASPKKENEAHIEESQTKHMEAPTERSSMTRKEKEVLTPP